MTVPRLLGAAYLALIVLALGGGVGGVPWISALVCLAALVVIGELWLRAVVAEAVAAPARLGAATMIGLAGVALVAFTLHVLRVPITAHPLAVGLAVLATGLAAVALLRERAGRPPADPRLAGTLLAVAIPGALALVIGGAAVLAYARLPHPPPPGYTSVALNGWAAGIDRPIAVPARGLQVPIRVSSNGEPDATVALRVLIGARTVNARPVRIAAGTTRSVEVYVPAPPDGCLHRIEISLGVASTVFYGRGPVAVRRPVRC